MISHARGLDGQSADSDRRDAYALGVLEEEEQRERERERQRPVTIPLRLPNRSPIIRLLIILAVTSRRGRSVRKQPRNWNGALPLDAAIRQIPRTPNELRYTRRSFAHFFRYRLAPLPRTGLASPNLLSNAEISR